MRARPQQLTFRGANQRLADAAIGILGEEKPMTLRQLFYRCVSAGLLSNTQKEYKRLGNLMTRLRQAREIPLNWIVDHIRATLKPSSWSGLDDFGDTVRRVYRKDFWASLPHHVEVFVEKDAIAGTVQPITHQYDVALRVCRGYCSLSFVGEIAEQWSAIDKPIFAFYVGDYDPSGFDLERDLVEKIENYSGLGACFPHHSFTAKEVAVKVDDLMSCGGAFYKLTPAATPSHNRIFFWHRLAVRQSDFADFDLIPLPVKLSDKRAAGFLKKHGSRCAEVDALPPSELRRRVQEAITAHIHSSRWEKLQETERLEKESLERYLSGWAGDLRN